MREKGVVTSGRAATRPQGRSAVTKEALRRPSVPLPHAPLAHLDDVGQLVLIPQRRRHVKGRLAVLVEHKIGGMGRIGEGKATRSKRHPSFTGAHSNSMPSSRYRQLQVKQAPCRCPALWYGCTAPLPQHYYYYEVVIRPLEERRRRLRHTLHAFRAKQQ